MGHSRKEECEQKEKSSTVKHQKVKNQHVCKSEVEQLDAKVINADILNLKGDFFGPCLPTPISESVTLTESGRYIICDSFVGNIVINGFNISLDLNNKNIRSITGPVINVKNSSYVKVFGGIVLSPDGDGILIEDSDNVVVSEFQTSPLEVSGPTGSSGSVKAGVTVKAIPSPYRAFRVLRSRNIRVLNFDIQGVTHQAGDISESENVRLNNISTYKIRNFGAPALLTARDTGNFSLDASSFSDIQHVDFEQADKAIVRADRLLDSKFTNNRILSTQFATFSEGLSVRRRFRLFDMRENSNIVIDNNDASGNVAESVGPVDLSFDNLYIGNSRDVFINRFRNIEPLVRADPDAIRTTLRGICLEDDTFVTVKNNEINTPVITDGGLDNNVIGMDIIRGGEHTIFKNSANTGLIVNSFGRGRIFGFNIRDLDSTATLSRNVSNNNGGESDETIGFNAVAENPRANVIMDNNISNSNTSRLFGGGFRSNMNGTNFLNNVSNRNSIRTLSTFKLETKSSKLARLSVPRKIVGAKNLNKSELKKSVIDAANVNNIDPFVFGFLLTGTETRDQTNCIIENCQSDNPLEDETAVASASTVSAFGAKLGTLNKNNLHKLHVNNITKSATSYLRFGVRIGRIPLPSLLPRPSNNLSVTRLKADSNTAAIALKDVNKASVESNNMKQNTVGMDIDGGQNVNVNNNSMQESEVGLIVTSQNARIVGNSTVNSRLVGFADASPKPNAVLTNQSINDTDAFLSSTGVISQVETNATTGALTSVAGGNPVSAFVQNIRQRFL